MRSCGVSSNARAPVAIDNKLIDVLEFVFLFVFCILVSSFGLC